MKINWGFGPPKDDDDKSGKDVGKPAGKSTKTGKKSPGKTTSKGLAKGFGKAAPSRGAGDESADTGDDAANSSEVHGWTAGASMATNGITWALRGALIAGPLALAMHLLMPSSDSVVQQNSDGDRVGETAAVGEFAQLAIEAWLETPSDRADSLTTYFGEEPRALPEIPWKASNAEVAEIVRAENGLWSVVVGVDAAEGKPEQKPGQAPEAAAGNEAGDSGNANDSSGTEGNKGSGDGVERITSGRLYFRVPVLYVEGEMVAQALPAPVPPPASVDQLDSAYEYELKAQHPAFARVTNFLTAMLVNGDPAELEAYSNPGSSFEVLDPSPYADLDIQSIFATTEDEAATSEDTDTPPEDGEVIDISVDVVLYGSNEQPINAQYALVLQAREGRWEVAEIRLSPDLAEAVPVPTPTPTSTETTTSTPESDDQTSTDTGSPDSTATQEPTSEETP